MARCVAMAALCIIPVGACVDVLGITPMREDPCGAHAHAVEGCDDCMRASCCEEMLACDGPCRDAYACLALCEVDDPVCRSACMGEHEAAVQSDELAALDTCRRGGCVEACIGASGFDGFIAGAPAQCGACVDQCEDFGYACTSDAVCEQYAACIMGCTDPSCRFRCHPAAPDENLPAYSFAVCIRGCADDCGVVSDFSCVDDYTWFGVNEPVAFDLELLRLAPNPADPSLPAAGVHGRFCGVNQCGACAAAVTEDDPMSDEEGVLRVEVPYGSIGCFGLWGPGYERTLVYPGRPIVNGPDPTTTMTILEEGGVADFAGLFGLVQQEGLGALYVRQYDCRFSKNVDVRFETTTQDSGTIFAYATDASGFFNPDGRGDQAIVLNHPVGPTTIRGRVDGEEVSSFSLSVAPDTPTLVFLFPRYSQ